MPEYLYQHPETQEIKSVIQGVSEPHAYTEDNIKWNRIFTVPQVNGVGTIDPFDRNQFINATSSTKGNYGDLLDRSRELSQQRKDKLGYDPIQNKHFDDYSATRKGRKHPNDNRHRRTKGVDVDY